MMHEYWFKRTAAFVKKMTLCAWQWRATAVEGYLLRHKVLVVSGMVFQPNSNFLQKKKRVLRWCIAMYKSFLMSHPWFTVQWKELMFPPQGTIVIPVAEGQENVTNMMAVGRHMKKTCNYLRPVT